MDRILDLIKQRQSKKNRPLIIGIDGRCGSGKTTLSLKLKNILNCEVVHLDHFFLQKHQRTNIRLNEIGGNFDYERFILEVKNPILNKKEIRYQIFNCSTMCLESLINIDINKIIIVEGTYSFHPLINEIYDLKIFLNIDKEEQINRLRNRDGEFFLTKFVNEWIPKEEAYFSKFNIEEDADIIMNN